MAYNTNTVLLLHCNGTDGSTTFTDSEQTPKTVTANGNAQIDTAQYKFGSASGIFNGSTDYLTNTSTDWDLDGQFTIDCWYKSNTRQNYSGIINAASANGGSYLGWTIGSDYINTSNQPLRFIWFNGGSAVINITGTTDINDGIWHHFAVTRDGSNNIRLFLDGTQQGGTVNNSTTLATDNTLVIGRLWDDTPTNYFDGWVDEVRILKGEAVWTSNFTPPTSAYEGYGEGFVPKVIFFS